MEPPLIINKPRYLTTEEIKYVLSGILDGILSIDINIKIALIAKYSNILAKYKIVPNGINELKYRLNQHFNHSIVTLG